MNCRRVRHRLTQYLDGDLPASAQAAVAAHLETCPRCRAEAAGLRRAEDALEALAAVEPAPEVTADLRRRLATAPGRTLPWAWVGGALAAAAAAVAAALLPSITSRPPAPQPLPEGARIAAPHVAIEPPQPQPPITSNAPEPPRSHQPYQAPAQIVHRPAEDMPLTPSEVTGKEPPLAEQSEPVPPRFLPIETAEPSYGIILLLGQPQPILPSSRCHLEVSLPGGAKSVLDQSVERDAAGKPRAVQISYQQIASETEALNQGG